MEDIPEISPSPLHYSVELYSIQNAELLSPEAGTQTGANTSPEDTSNLEQPPLPQQLSIRLYALPDVFLSQNPRNHGLHYLEGIPNSFPDPQQISIGLYPLPYLPHVQPVPELTPFPPIHEISLFTKPSIEQLLAPTVALSGIKPSDVSDVDIEVRQDQPKSTALSAEPLAQGLESARNIQIQGSSHFIVGADTETQPPQLERSVTPDSQAEELEPYYEDSEREIAFFSSVPHVGRVAEAVGLIIERCKNVEHYQDRVYAMASRCLKVVKILSSKTSRLSSTDLVELANKLFVIFTNIQTFIQGWPSTKGVFTLVGKEEIQVALDKCKDELGLALDLVQE